MTGKTEQLVTEEQFRRELEKYLTAAQQGSGPIAVTRDAKIVGFFVAVHDYEALYGRAIKKLLSSRAKGPTVSQAEAREHIRRLLKKRSRKP
jgi:hypothetical protein